MNIQPGTDVLPVRRCCLRYQCPAKAIKFGESPLSKRLTYLIPRSVAASVAILRSGGRALGHSPYSDRAINILTSLESQLGKCGGVETKPVSCRETRRILNCVVDWRRADKFR
jgi:hypothetical protein